MANGWPDDDSKSRLDEIEKWVKDQSPPPPKKQEVLNAVAKCRTHEPGGNGGNQAHIDVVNSAHGKASDARTQPGLWQGVINDLTHSSGGEDAARARRNNKGGNY